MKLRNKKTDAIVELIRIEITDDRWIRLDCRQRNGVEYCMFYRSLVELNDEWMDYTPRKPLIKDEKVRKAIMSWYEALPLDDLCDKRILFSNGDFCVGIYRIDCGNYVALKGIKERFYYVEELCGGEK